MQSDPIELEGGLIRITMWVKIQLVVLILKIYLQLIKNVATTILI